MTKESSLWRWLSTARRDYRERLHMCRVENSTMRGMPDVEGHLLGQGQFWMELKSAPHTTRGSPRFPTRHEQAEWMYKRWRSGGAAFMLCQVGSGHGKRLYLIPGIYAREMHEEQPDERRLLELTVILTNSTAKEVVRVAASWACPPTPVYPPDIG